MAIKIRIYICMSRVCARVCVCVRVRVRVCVCVRACARMHAHANVARTRARKQTKTIVQYVVAGANWGLLKQDLRVACLKNDGLGRPDPSRA